MDVGAWTSTALYRSHEGSVPVENLQPWSDRELAQHFALGASVFRLLAPYKRLLMEEHRLHGYPLLRPLYLHFPHGNRPAAFMERLQFMLGPLLLIVPVTTPGLQYFDQPISKDSNPPDEDEDDDDSLPDEDEDDDDAASFQSNGDNSQSFTRKGRLIRAFYGLVKRAVMQLADRLLSRSELPRDLPVANTAPSAPNNAPSRRPPPTSKPVLIAPQKPPLPRHGRPYLPPGRWQHVWTGRILNITNTRGVFVTNDNNVTSVNGFHLPCPPGQPPVFIRLLDRMEMNRLLYRPLAGEDAKYWLDPLVNDQQQQKPSLGTPLDRAMYKYEIFLASLTALLDDGMQLFSIQIK
jgi:hypothetical protein